MTRGTTSSKSTNHSRATTNEQTSQSDDFFQARVVSEKESCGVIKRLTAITISTILYNRNMFPASDYGQRSHRGQVFHILDKKAQTTQARQVVSLVQSLFEPIGQKYLKSVVIGFTEDQNNPNDLIEAYIIHYQYSNGEVSVTRKGKGGRDSSVQLGDEDIGDSAAKTFAKLVELCRSQENLRKRNVYLTLQLRYTDDTPVDYEPDGFKPTTCDDFTIDGEIETFKCGPVTTPFHGFKIKANLPQ